ncbi:hypothetical protein BLNAU_13737 [Blattamonas nauphoetae]|uniref:Uncharacterized protein n=1 Tax=Blattamonas nauphoetae TaxID=2049346 RepID=A0ABQ9XFW4_9EUKA|nr:hypothetical protein BLNAU_13737 [Blattamonas nauphoetae]
MEAESKNEKARKLRSLADAVQAQPVLDDSQKIEAERFLNSLNLWKEKVIDAFLSNFGQSSVDSSRSFIQIILVLISSADKDISNAAIGMLKRLILRCSAKTRLSLVQTTMIPQLITILNPVFLSFARTSDIHPSLLSIISNSFKLATPDGLTELEIENHDEQQAVSETIFQQVLVPSENYLGHLCVNYKSIHEWHIDAFQRVLGQLLRISPYYQPTMELVLQMPIIHTIPSCLTFFETDKLILFLLFDITNSYEEWNTARGEFRRMWKTIHRMLRKEGMEDVLEEKLLNDKKVSNGTKIVDWSITLNDQQGMHIRNLY